MSGQRATPPSLVGTAGACIAWKAGVAPGACPLSLAGESRSEARRSRFASEAGVRVHMGDRRGVGLRELPEGGHRCSTRFAVA